MNRRRFLTALGITLGTIGFYSPRLFFNRKSVPSSSFQGKRLIIIHLNGGNDGLYTLAPKNNDVIDSHRKILMSELYKGIEWEDDFLLNNKLNDFSDLAQMGWLSIIPNVGYPNQSTSHIISERVWESGYLPGENPAITGWFGRLIDENKLKIGDSMYTAISFTTGNQLIYNGKINRGVYWNGNSIFKKRLEQIVNNNIDFIGYEHLLTELENNHKLLQILNDIEPYPGYPTTVLGNNLATISSMIKKQKPYKLFHLMHGGYDTHHTQIPRLNDLYTDLGNCLKIFAYDLNEIQEWENTQVLVYSEFGRSIDENANVGTDHGTAGPVFVLGGKQIYGSLADMKPNYDTYKKVGQPYLKYQIDYRDIFNRVIDKWLL